MHMNSINDCLFYIYNDCLFYYNIGVSIIQYDSVMFHISLYGMLTGNTTAVYCDGCSFLIPTDHHGNPLNDSLCPVRAISLHI